MSNYSFEINRCNLVTSETYILHFNQTHCPICRIELNCDSIHNQNSAQKSCILTGVCNHSFHKDCIETWIKKKPMCPVCCQNWSVMN